MLDIKLFGNLIIEKEGQTSPIIRRQKGCAVLAYLIIQGQPQPRETIADLFWDAKSTQQAQVALRVTIQRVRQHVPDVESSRTQLRFAPSSQTTVDLYQLESALQLGTSAQIDHALSLYNGPLLDNLYLDDAPRFNEWLQIAREQWRQRIWSAYGELCQHYLKQKIWSAGVKAAQRWLALDPLNEEALAFALRFLGHNGQGEQAWQLYQFSREQLWDQLQVEPEPETSHLAAAMRTLQPSQAISIAPLNSPTQNDEVKRFAGLPTNSIIPYQRNTEFVGRDGILQEIAQTLEHSASPCTVIITGMAGIGKTQLAVEFCYRYGRHFSGGCYWLSFAGEETIEDEIVKIGGERGMGLYSDAEKLNHVDKVGRVCLAWQADSPRLLVFDNCESAELLTKWLPVTGGCRVLVTGRRGRWPSNIQLHLHPLTTLSPPESIKLLKRLVSHINIDIAEKIATELEHLPLALYLAGRFLHRYQQVEPAQYLTQLRSGNLLQHPSLQGRGLANSPTGHELHIARTFALNLDQLDAQDEVDEMALHMLACVVNFAHGEPIPQTILNSCVLSNPTDFMQALLAVDGLNRLIDLGILRVEEEGTVQIHRLLAMYTQHQFSYQVAQAQTDVAQYITDLLHEQYEKTRFLGHLPLDAVHLQTMAAQDNDFGSRLAYLWAGHLRDIGDRKGANAVLVTAVQQKKARQNEADLLLALLFNFLGTVTWELGAQEDAWSYFDEVLAIRRQVVGEKHTLTAQSIQNLAILHSRVGQLEQANAACLKAIDIYRSLEPPDHQQIGDTYYSLAMNHRRAGELDQTIAYMQRSLETLKKIASEESLYIARALAALGYGHYMKGDYAQGTPLAQKAWQIHQKLLGEKHAKTLTALAMLGLINSRVGKVTIALEQLETAKRWMEESDSSLPRQIGFVTSNLGQYFYWAQDFERAESCLAHAANLFASNHSYHEDSAPNLFYLIRTYIAQNKLDEAQNALHQLTQWQNSLVSKSHYDVAYRLWAEAELVMAEGDTAMAIIVYQRAIAVFDSNGLGRHPDIIQLKQQFLQNP